MTNFKHQLTQKHSLQWLKIDSFEYFTNNTEYKKTIFTFRTDLTVTRITIESIQIFHRIIILL